MQEEEEERLREEEEQRQMEEAERRCVARAVCCLAAGTQLHWFGGRALPHLLHSSCRPARGQASRASQSLGCR